MSVIKNKDINNPISSTSTLILEPHMSTQFKADDIKTILKEAEQMKLKLQQANITITKII